MENGEFSHEKMVIFHSYVNVYQRVTNNKGGWTTMGMGEF